MFKRVTDFAKGVVFRFGARSEEEEEDRPQSQRKNRPRVPVRNKAAAGRLYLWNKRANTWECMCVDVFAACARAEENQRFLMRLWL